MVVLSVLLFSSFGGSYDEVTIGNQVWMAKNLNLDKFRNGDPIPHAKTKEEWKKAAENKQPAWCYYDNDPSNGEKYGKLYNWYAVNDPRGLAPEGWHVPSDEEWTTLTHHLGGIEGAAGTKMKSTSGWEKDGNGTNESGFSGLPGGLRTDDWVVGLGDYVKWWSSTESDTGSVWTRALFYGSGEVRRETTDKGKIYGFSVRCLRDVWMAKNLNVVKFRDEVTIGNQVWMAKNLNVDKFRNGDPIPHAKTKEEWKKAAENKQPAWCYYDNDPSNGEKYGKLYNWYAVNDPRGLAPEGWHVPSDEEWTTLTHHLGGIEGAAGTKMKSTSGWEKDGNGTNESGFSGLPGGARYSSGTFNDIGTNGYWWSSTEVSETNANNRYLIYESGIVYKFHNHKVGGFSVRYLRY